MLGQTGNQGLYSFPVACRTLRTKGEGVILIACRTKRTRAGRLHVRSKGRFDVRLDPSEPLERLPLIAALEYFTDRENAIDAFQHHVNAANVDKVLVFYGVGGIGKTALVQRLAQGLRESKPPLPCALFSMENIGDQTRAYREVLVRWRTDLESQFRISFPHFDLCLGIMLAREGGDPPPLFQRPSLKPWLEFGGAAHPPSPGSRCHRSPDPRR